jgi:prepilin-type N-terminal cleavage/methylation domain-containing protein
MIENRKRVERNNGFSLLEILAVVVLMGIVAMIAIPRFGKTSDSAKVTTCHINTGNIEVQASLWFRNKGTWPAGDLSDIFANPNYFPDGRTVCPLDGTSYSFDSTAEAVVGHSH